MNRWALAHGCAGKTGRERVPADLTNPDFHP